jgi:hypothetical protein
LTPKLRLLINVLEVVLIVAQVIGVVELGDQFASFLLAKHFELFPNNNNNNNQSALARLALL